MKSILLTSGLLIMLAVPAFSQDATMDLSEAEREQAVDRVCQLLKRFYVLPEAAEKMVQHIRTSQAAGALDSLTTESGFADYMTAELRSISPDKHLRLFIGPNPDEQPREERILSRAMRRFERREENCGVTRIEILDGNIGYMNIRSVMFSEATRVVVSSALRLLANTDAIIFDLRENDRGGDATYLTYMFSYFFDDITQLSSIYWRHRDRTDEFWTRKDVAADRMTDIPLYVLISNATFSGAEAFAYDLQALNRATIIGEVSAGAAHPTSSWVVYGDVRISIPIGRAINPITGTNWEGTGVIPDIKVAASEALEVAIDLATPEAEERRTALRKELVSSHDRCFRNLERAAVDLDDGQSTQAEALVRSSLLAAIANGLVNESTINRLGYDYLNRGSLLMAIAIFKANTEFYPESANVWDSLGEAYVKAGDRESAIENYRRALEINPESESARGALEDL